MTQISNNLSQAPVSTQQICSPGNLRGRRTSSTTLTLTWDEPYATCHLCPDAVGYEVTGAGIDSINLMRPPCEIKGLSPDREYLIYVRAKAAGNNVSTASPIRLFKLPPPGKPGIPELSNITDTSATVTWAASTGIGGSIRYRVYLNDSLVAQTEQLHLTLTHLRNYTDYRFDVRAYYEGSYFDSMSEPASVTFRTLLRAPILRFSQRNGLGRLAWAPNYWKFPNHVGSINGHMFTTDSGRLGYNFRLTDLLPGPVLPKHFKFEVRAQVGGVFSEVSTLEATVYDDIPPSKPGTPIVTDITGASATLTWEPSSDNKGVIHYECRLNGIERDRSPDTRYTYTDLEQGTYYLVTVRAQDEAGNLSMPSEVRFRTTGPSPEPRPLAPTVSITPQTSTSAMLRWSFLDGRDEDLFFRGASIMINGQYHNPVMMPAKSKRLDSLIPDMEYTISVSNFFLGKQFSEPTTLVYIPRDITPPRVPGNLREVTSIANSTTLTWDESTDDIGMYGYVIYNNHEYVDGTPLTEYTAVDLFPGSHLFEVRALDLSGNASEPASIVVHIKS